MIANRITQYEPCPEQPINVLIAGGWDEEDCEDLALQVRDQRKLLGWCCVVWGAVR